MGAGKVRHRVNRTSRILEGRAGRVRTPLTADVVSERVAYLTRKAVELEDEARHHCDGRDSSYAAGCAAEAAAMRRELDVLTALKFEGRARPRTITFERDPGRVARASRSLTEEAEAAMTRQGRDGFAQILFDLAGRALDDLLTIGRRKADKQPKLLKNTGTRIS